MTQQQLRPAKPITASSRMEAIGDINLPVTNQPYTLPSTTIPNDRFYWGLRLQFEGRLTNAAANFPTGVQADAPFSLIDRITVEGYHRIRGTKEQFVNVRGADLRELNRIYSAHAPLSNPTTALALAANGTNDFRFSVDLPFVPPNVPVDQQLGYLLDAPNYDQLTLTVYFGDDKSVFTGQTTASTFSAINSAVGNPRIRVSGLYAMGGPDKFAGYVPGRLWMSYQEVTSGDIVNGNSASRLFNIPKGFRIRSLLLKTGVKSAAVTSGNNVYNTLSNAILSNLIINQGINHPIRRYTDQYALAEETGLCYGLTPTTGFGLIDFCQRGNLWEALRTQGLVAGTSGDTDFYVQADEAAGAGQAALLLTTELRTYPKRQ